MLDRAVALAGGERDIGGGHVVVQIDEGAPRAALGERDRERRRRAFRPVLDRRQRRNGRAAEAAQRGGARPGRGALGKAGAQREAAARRADALDCGVDRVGHKGGEALVEAQPALRLGEQMQGRVPAAGDREQVAIDRHALAVRRAIAGETLAATPGAAPRGPPSRPRGARDKAAFRRPGAAPPRRGRRAGRQSRQPRCPMRQGRGRAHRHRHYRRTAPRAGRASPHSGAGRSRRRSPA